MRSFAIEILKFLSLGLWDPRIDETPSSPAPADLPPFKGIPERHKALWSRIEAFEIDDPCAELPFSLRLSRMMNWDSEFASRAVDEYKRFMFLCCVSEQMVSPSLVVDEVWHLHLQYTRSYRVNFCEQVLGRFVDHNPSTGGAEEEEKFSRLYGDTLRAYYRCFGMPARDVWGPENLCQVYWTDTSGRKLKIVWASESALPSRDLKRIVAVRR